MKKLQPWLIIMLVMTMLLGNVVMAHALVFTDIEGHWSEEFVEEIYEREITTGYTDATYKPDNSISGLEIVTMLARMLQYDSETENYTEDYEDQLDEYKIPQWAGEFVAFLLSEDIVIEEELNQFMLDGNPTNIRRYEMVIFVGRVLESYGGHELKMAYSIPYADEMFIPQTAKPYVDLMLSAEILDPASNDGRFLPLNHLSRGETAKLIAMTADLLDEYDPEEDEEEEPEEDEDDLEAGEVDYIEATFNGVVELEDRSILDISDEKNIRGNYELSEDVEIIIGGREVDLDDLTQDQLVEVRLVNGIVTRIKEETDQVAEIGYFEKFLASTNHVLTLKDEAGKTQVYTIPSSAKYTIDKQKASYEDFQKGDLIKIYKEKNKIVEVAGKSKTEYIEGVISKKDTKEDYLEITTEDQRVLIFEVDDHVTYTRDGKKSSFEDIRVHDEISLELEFNQVNSVHTTIVKSTITGYIRNIIIGEQSLLEVEIAGGDYEEFIITDEAEVMMGDEDAEIYDLRLGYFVEINIESEVVASVYTARKIETVRMTGTVVELNERKGTLEIEIIEDATPTILAVTITEDTQYDGMNGRTTAKGINEGDEVLLVGQTQKDEFIVERLIVLSN